MERYNSLNNYFFEKYGEKIGKLSLDAGFSCPNRDGKISNSGCIFCSERGSGDFAHSEYDIKSQIEIQKKIVQNKWHNKKFIAYFQNFTNTYETCENLEKIYKKVLEDRDIIGLAIATRADCLDMEILNLLKNFSKKTDLWLEIGMQSSNEKTIDFINRGYSHKYLDEKLKELDKLKIKYVLHVIFGLPTDTKDDMINSIKYVNSTDASGIKIHSLYIQNDAPLYEYYLKNPFEMLSKDEYTDLVAESISILKKDIVIHRLTGDADKEKLFLPKWSADKLSVIGEINHKLKIKNIVQGDNFCKN